MFSITENALEKHGLFLYLALMGSCSPFLSSFSPNSIFLSIHWFYFSSKPAVRHPAVLHMKVRFTARFKMAVVSPDPNQRRESPLPTVNERLGHLKPSRELLEYYRRKIAEYDGEYEEMVRKLELYKCTYEEQVSKAESLIVNFLFRRSIFRC